MRHSDSIEYYVIQALNNLALRRQTHDRRERRIRTRVCKDVLRMTERTSYRNYHLWVVSTLLYLRLHLDDDGDYGDILTRDMVDDACTELNIEDTVTHRSVLRCIMRWAWSPDVRILRALAAE